MKFTQINGEPYGASVVDKLAIQEAERLADLRRISSVNPYVYGSTIDRLTVLFSKEDDNHSLRLPLRSNHTKVFNRTDYASRQKSGLVMNFFSGKPLGTEVVTLLSFLESVKDMHSPIISMETVKTDILNPNYNIPNDTPHILSILRNIRHPIGDKLEDQVQYLTREFSLYPEEFYIDPASDVRVDRRLLRDGSIVYRANLTWGMYVGVSDAPGIKTIGSQTLRVKESAK